MKIVIDIPKELYRDVVKNRFIYDEDGEVITHAIINSTPLPNHHGRLIDADDFFQMFEELDMEPYNDAPTIIEGSDSGCRE